MTDINPKHEAKMSELLDFFGLDYTCGDDTSCSVGNRMSDAVTGNFFRKVWFYVECGAETVCIHLVGDYCFVVAEDEDMPRDLALLRRAGLDVGPSEYLFT